MVFARTTPSVPATGTAPRWAKVVPLASVVLLDVLLLALLLLLRCVPLLLPGVLTGVRYIPSKLFADAMSGGYSSLFIAYWFANDVMRVPYLDRSALRMYAAARNLSFAIDLLSSMVNTIPEMGSTALISFGSGVKIPPCASSVSHHPMSRSAYSSADCPGACVYVQNCCRASMSDTNASVLSWYCNLMDLICCRSHRQSFAADLSSYPSCVLIRASCPHCIVPRPRSTPWPGCLPESDTLHICPHFFLKDHLGEFIRILGSGLRSSDARRRHLRCKKWRQVHCEHQLCLGVRVQRFERLRILQVIVLLFVALKNVSVHIGGVAFERCSAAPCRLTTGGAGAISSLPVAVGITTWSSVSRSAGAAATRRATGTGCRGRCCCRCVYAHSSILLKLLMVRQVLTSLLVVKCTCPLWK